MLSTVWLLFALILSVLVAQFLKQQWVGRRFPPGPTPLPFLGNLWALDFRIDKFAFLELTRSYGNIYTVWIGQKPSVVVNGCKALRDCLTSEVFAQRPASPYIIKMLGDNGITFANGHLWKQNRRFASMALRNLGLGKRKMEVRIHEVAQQLVKHFAAQEGRPVNPCVFFITSTCNVICAVAFGRQFSIDDKHILHFIKAYEMIVTYRGSALGQVYDAFSSLMPLLPGSHRKVFACWEEVRSFIREEIELHRERWVAGDPPEDMIDYYLDEMDKNKENPASLFSEDSLRTIVLEFFFAGMDSTAVTLLWALAYMVDYPDVQANVQKELDAVLEPSEMICYEDLKRLPYTNAVIHEVQRYASIIPGEVARWSSKDTSFQGFFIPKDTIIYVNLMSALYDPEYWETPQQFNPNHFLDEEGNFVSKEAFLAFSTGHRVCLGEQLARAELFLIFTSLLRVFTFRLPREEKKPLSFDYIVGVTTSPRPYQICAIPR